MLRVIIATYRTFEPYNKRLKLMCIEHEDGERDGTTAAIINNQEYSVEDWDALALTAVMLFEPNATELVLTRTISGALWARPPATWPGNAHYNFGQSRKITLTHAGVRDIFRAWKESDFKIGGYFK